MTSRIYVAGGQTLIGRALIGGVRRTPDVTLITEPEPDLADRAAVEQFFRETRPDPVFGAATVERLRAITRAR